MTLQQLEYIAAVNKYRHFVTAAESCGVTQSTLSSMIHKLEEELDVTIFDRSAHPIRPTNTGEEILRQAQVVLFHAKQLKETSSCERKRLSGDLSIGITPTISPYIVPKLFRYFTKHYPDITLHPTEMHREGTLSRLRKAEIDVAILSVPDSTPDLLEIPLYKERFAAYVSTEDPLYAEEELCFKGLPMDRLWSLKNQICFQSQICSTGENLCDSISSFESGSLVTLFMLVEENGGFTFLPEMHIAQLSKNRRQHVRPLVNPVPMRQVSMFVRHDYVRESLLNALATAIKSIIPKEMIDERLLKFPIRL